MSNNTLDQRIFNMYNFAQNNNEASNPYYVQNRKWEYTLMNKQRQAVSFCKKIAGINHNDLSKLIDTDKENIERCLNDYFIKNDPNYFGERDIIFLDLDTY